MAPTDERSVASTPLVETWQTIERIPHPLIRRFAAYWDLKRRGRRAPARADIDPLELRDFLSHLYMFDVVDPGARLRYRLVGSDVAVPVSDATGRLVDEILPPERYAKLRPQYDDIIRNFALRYSIADHAWEGRPYRRYHRLLMPLSNDQIRVNIILGIGYALGTENAELLAIPLDAAIQITDMVDARVVAVASEKIGIRSR